MATRRILDRSPYYAEYYERLDRVLSRPQLAGIGISGCVGSGVLVASSAVIAVTGSTGGVLSYIIAGGTVACVLYSVTEMVACRPLAGSLIDLPHTFLDPACGFAVGVSYTLASICSMATLTAQSAELTALLRDPPKRHKIGTEVGVNLFFISLTAISHCLGVKIYGKIERVVMWFKLCLFVLLCVLMVVVNAGGGGPRQGPYYGNYTSHGFTPGWKPTGFDTTTTTFLKTTGVDDTHFGIAGAGGQLFAFLTATTIAMFSCTGGEMVALTAGEAKEPWKDIPFAMSFVYLVPLSLYPLVFLSASSNVNYADPNLPKIWAKGTGPIPKSPFVIAVQETSLHGLPKALNLFFIITSYTAANTALYAASRNFFILSQQYLPAPLARFFGRTNNGHTPIRAIGLCSALGFLSLVGLSQYAYSQPRITLSEFYTGTIACVFVCLCLTFLRFKAGLERLGKRMILCRDDPLYISKLFKSRWQPLPAYIGIFGCSFVVVWSGIPALYILAARGGLESSGNLKSSAALAFDVIGTYIGPVIFASLYLTYKYVHPRSHRVDIRKLTPSHYVLDDFEDFENDQPEAPSRKPSDTSDTLRNDSNAFELESPNESRLVLEESFNGRRRPLVEEAVYQGMETSPGTDAIEAERARREERQRIEDILEKRPKRMQRGFWREIWSFVVAD